MQNNLTIQKNDLIPLIQDENHTIIEIADKMYAIKTSSVLEIIKIMELERPSELPSCVLGLMKYKDTPVGVIDLREIFNKERIVYNLSARIIVAKTQKGISAIICDKVSDIKKLSENKIKEIPYQQETSFYSGLYINDEENIYILDIDSIENHIELNKDKFNYNNENFIVNDEDSLEILKERKNFLIKIEDEIQTTTPLYDMGVSFIINNVKYYINMASVKEFFKIDNQKFIKVPNTPNFIFGLVNIKGEYITVLDIRSFFGNSKTEIKEKSTIIILNSEEYKIGILADEICESMNIDFEELIQNKIHKQDDNKPMEFVKDNEIYQILDVEKLFQDERLTIA